MIDRVQDRRTFVALRARGVRVRRGHLSAVHLPGDPSGPTRLAFAVGRRVGGAVVRNRLRRRLRAIFVDIDRSDPSVVPRGALLVSAAPGAVSRGPDELRDDVIRLLDDLRARKAS